MKSVKSLSRRRFIQTTAAAVAATGLSGALLDLRADPLGLPIGLQLYTVGSDLQKDFDGTLKKIADIGYKSVEGASFVSFQGKSTADLHKSFSDAGLKCPSAHVVQTTMTDGEMDKLIDFCQTSGSNTWSAPPHQSVRRDQRSKVSRPNSA